MWILEKAFSGVSQRLPNCFYSRRFFRVTAKCQKKKLPLALRDGGDNLVTRNPTFLDKNTCAISRTKKDIIWQNCSTHWLSDILMWSYLIIKVTSPIMFNKLIWQTRKLYSFVQALLIVIKPRRFYTVLFY